MAEGPRVGPKLSCSAARRTTYSTQTRSIRQSITSGSAPVIAQAYQFLALATLTQMSPPALRYGSLIARLP